MNADRTKSTAHAAEVFSAPRVPWGFVGRILIQWSPSTKLVSHRPIHGLDVDELSTYVAALEDPTAAPATLQWRGPNRVDVRARLEPSEVVSTQINYHPGWHAWVAGTARRIYSDGLGFMAVDPRCAGDCEIALEFDGGAESNACWAASSAVLLMVLAATARNFLKSRRLTPH
jgi:hypothetical protein